MTRPVLIIHGGAGRSFKDLPKRRRIQKKMFRFLTLAYQRLLETNALEAVTLAVRLLEDDPDFNAGTGSRLQADGRARLSASMMDGKRETFAGVINLENIKNPVLVARLLLDETYRVLSGPGALEFALKKGFKVEDPRTRASIEQWRKWRDKEGSDTVGACALDARGQLASATSTGGRGFETPGRVSDSGMPVANFADSRCAVSATGIGEDIIEAGLAVKIATRIQDGKSLRQAFTKTFQEIRQGKRLIGAIGVDYRGKIAWETTTDALIYGWKKGSSMAFCQYIHKRRGDHRK